MAQQYQEQIESLKPLPSKEAEAAQASFMSAVRKMVAAGEIELIEVSMGDEEDGENAETE